MALIREWGMFQPGVMLGLAGLLLGFITLFMWRRMENKAPVCITGKTAAAVIVGICGALALGAGMCFSMVWGRMVEGIIIGFAGIVILLCLFPMTKGLRE